MPQSPLDQLLTAVDSYLNRPQIPCHASADLNEAIWKLGNQAIKQRDEDVSNEEALEAHNRELEAENAELRRRLRAQGISDRVAS